MEISSLFHVASSQYAYAYDENTLHIKLKTKMGDVDEAYLVFGDPYDFRDNQVSGNLSEVRWEWHTELVKMEKTGSDGVYDFWFVAVKPNWKRMRYAFYLVQEDTCILYGEKKTVAVSGSRDIELVNQKNFFTFPFINRGDVYQAPQWTKDVIWYQIFPERFCNGDPSNDPKPVKRWEEPLTSHMDHYGGDLQGIIDKLDYLKDLGISGIYLTPIFHSNSNHKYDTIDYKSVDPHFGDKELLKKLVNEAHERGIKVMLDIVFNHCGFYFEPFQNVLEKGETSEYKDWFHIKEYPVYDPKDKLHVSKELNFHTFAFTPMMPKINTENEAAKAYLLDIIRFWSHEAKIDGWRLDVANEVDHGFWRVFRETVKACNPEAYIMGEVWHDANPWLKGDQFDAVMNYPLNEAMLSFFAREDQDGAAFVKEVNRAYFNYPRNVNESMYNLLDSHDTARFLHLAGENVDKLKLAYVYMMTQMGAPSIYYGNEVGMTGKHDPDCRRPMIWDKEKQDLELLSFMKKLIRIRQGNPVLRHQGEMVFLQTGTHPDVVLYKRYTEEAVYYVVINRSGQRISYPLPEEMSLLKCRDLWENYSLELDHQIELKPYGFYVLKAE